MPAQSRATVAASPQTKVGSVKTFVRDKWFPVDGEGTEIKVLMQNYCICCVQNGVEPVSLNAFLDQIEKLFERLGIDIEVGDDHREYCLGMRLGPSARKILH